MVRATALACLLVLGVAGCATSGRPDWGADATWRPGGARLREAAIGAVRDPHVWAPLAGAAVFQIDGWDRKVSNWARRNTPVFGSHQSASDWSDNLLNASTASYLATVLITRDPQETGPWVRDKAQGLLVGLAAIGATGAVTSILKDTTGRTRPNGADTQSFPSGHSSHSAVTTGLARDNLEYVDLGPGPRRALDIGLDALSIGTAWARVEAGAHFPSDTLVGMALGRFASRFFDAAFMGSTVANRSADLTVAPLRGGALLSFQFSY